MNIYRILLSSLCLFLGINTSLAGDRTEREMLAIAQTHLAKRGTRSSTQTIQKVAEERYYCVYGNDKQGFVVVSHDDLFAPILGYSDSHFDVNSLPCGMSWWLGAISEQMASRIQELSPVTQSTEFVVVPHLCKTKWNQGDPYNFYTPVINGKHTPTGCVATAMSQIMKYFAYPAQGKGKGYYTLESNPSSRVTETISGVYEWEKMLDEYDAIGLTDEVRIPVARLMKDAGLATNMAYGSNGSGAYSVLAARGFCYNFSFDSLALRCFYREYFNQEMWMNTIYKELAEGRPILYTGVSASGGHAFVFDGVDEEGRIHVNWGWGGSGDGYFDFSDLNPIGSNDHYNSQQSMVFGFKCQDTPDEDETYKSLWCTSSGKSYNLSIEGKILKISSPPVYNYHFLWFYGQFGAFFKNLDGDSSKDTFIKIGQEKNDIPTFRGTDDLNNSIFFNKVKPGKYQLFLASKAKNEKECQPVRCANGAPYYELTIGEDGTTSMSEVKYFDDNSVFTGIHSSDAASPLTNKIYNLKGQQIKGSLESLYKGVYIINGKKVTR